jgi:uncharacterized protein (DUF433 family)
MSVTAVSRHIMKNSDLLGGEPVVSDTKTPVRAIVELWRMGSRPEEILLHLPHLTLAQVFDALSYYSDYQAEINSYIEQNHIPEYLLHPAVREIS